MASQASRYAAARIKSPALLPLHAGDQLSASRNCRTLRQDHKRYEAGCLLGWLGAKMMFLTPEELREWTDLIRPSAICRWLNERGYEYDLSAKGWPKVLRVSLSIRQAGVATKKEPQLRLP